MNPFLNHLIEDDCAETFKVTDKMVKILLIQLVELQNAISSLGLKDYVYLTGKKIGREIGKEVLSLAALDETIKKELKEEIFRTVSNSLPTLTSYLTGNQSQVVVVKADAEKFTIKIKIFNLLFDRTVSNGKLKKSPPYIFRIGNKTLKVKDWSYFAGLIAGIFEIALGEPFSADIREVFEKKVFYHILTLKPIEVVK